MNHISLEMIDKNYNINNQLHKILKVGEWENQPCFLIGGGESLIDFNFSRLDKYLTIGINKAFIYYPKVSINYLMDLTFYDEIKSEFLKYRGLKVLLAPPSIRKFELGVYLVKNSPNLLVQGDLARGIYGGQNSGVGALMLALTLRANPIYLLGFDFKCSKQSHWHAGYEKRNLVDFNKKLDNQRQEIEKIKPFSDALGIKVFNLSNNSNLQNFPFKEVSEVLK
jgi:hypothetical protein